MSSVLKVNEIQHTNGTSALTIDSSGVTTMTNRPAFAARLNSNAALDGTSGWGDTGGSSSLSSGTWDWVITSGGYNVGGHWSSSTNAFTVPVAGVYSFYYGLTMASAGSNQNFRFYVDDAGGTDFYRYPGTNYDSAGNTISSPALNVGILLAAGDIVKLQVGYTKTSSVEGSTSGFDRTWWGGHFVG